MLSGLSIRDMLLIERLDLDFRSGLNVLTGETGAGKSILLDSLGFVLGWRGRGGVVRDGASQGEVTAIFELPSGHGAHSLLQDGGFPSGDELVLRRTVSPDGRRQAYANDRRVSADFLRRLSGALVELHGQHDDRGLLNAKAHRGLLDAYCQTDAALLDTQAAWKSLSQARENLDQLRARLEKAEKDRDYLEHAVAELTELDPQPGEDVRLDTKRRRMQAAERVRGDVEKAGQAVGSEGAAGLLSDASRWLETANAAAEDATLDALLPAFSRVFEELGQIETGIADVLASLDFDPYEVERTEERLFAIRALARKHNVLPDDLATLARDLTGKLAEIDGGADEIKAALTAVEGAQSVYDRAARKLHDVRLAGAKRLDKAMKGELAPLKLDRAVFHTEISDAAPGPDGTDTVRFTVAPNPGAAAGALDKIASGGELSRFMLALKVCLSAREDGLTLIFDEIDRGVGGATADAVGKRLAAIARESQVLVVTHSPQVAAQGAHHWRVEKQVKKGVTSSTVIPVTKGARVDEIARMLAGDTISDAARAAASVLLGAD